MASGRVKPRHSWPWTEMSPEEWELQSLHLRKKAAEELQTRTFKAALAALLACTREPTKRSKKEAEKCRSDGTAGYH